MFFEIDYILFFKEVVFVFFNYVISVYLKLIDFCYIIILWLLINFWNYYFYIGRYLSYICICNWFIRIDKICIFIY